MNTIDPSAWLCDECFKIRVICQGKEKYQSIRDKVLEYSLKMLWNKDALYGEECNEPIQRKFYSNMDVLLVTTTGKVIRTHIETRRYKLYFPAR